MLKRFVLGSVGLVFILTPLFASADSNCPALSHTLARGARGNDVVQLQQFLIAQGSLQSGLATGYFGALTEAGVKSWQSKNGLDSVGIVGAKTRAAIMGYCGDSKHSTNNTNASITVLSPNGDQIYNAGDTIPVSWSIGGIDSSELANYKIGYLSLPVDSLSTAQNHNLTIGSMMGAYDLQSAPSLSGTKNITAPNGGWWTETYKSTSLNSRYTIVVSLNKSDPSVCSQVSFPKQFLPNTPPRCIPYRVVAYDESDGIFTIRQPRITGTVSKNDSTKTVSATITVATPDGCKPFKLTWNGVIPDPQTNETYTPPSNCSATTYTANYTHTFNYQTYSSTNEMVGSASLDYNNSWGDLFLIPIPSALR